MLHKAIKFLRNIKKKMLGTDVERFKKAGGKVGDNVHIFSSFLDPTFPWLIKIGDNTTITDVTILCHDASTQKTLGYSKVGRVIIGNNVFVGAKSVILPNVTIGDNVIIGAGSIVTKDIPSNTVAVGNPCRPIGNFDDYINKQKSMMQQDNVWNWAPLKMTEEEREILWSSLEKGIGFIR